MTSKSSGFTLIELLVVVAILGIIAAIGIVSYNGYVASAKKTSAKNIMQQISLGQSDYYSSYGEYYSMPPKIGFNMILSGFIGVVVLRSQ